jgi:hypothetical protein
MQARAAAGRNECMVRRQRFFQFIVHACASLVVNGESQLVFVIEIDRFENSTPSCAL